MFDWTQFIGRFHPLIVHLPIGILLLAALFEGLAMLQKYQYLKPTLSLIWFWGMVSAVTACGTGYLLSLSGEYDATAIWWHQWSGIALAIVAISVYFFKKRKPDGQSKALVLSLFILVIWTGHLGGNLTHGSDYLVKHSPPTLKAWWGEMDHEARKRGITDVQEALIYQDIIAPILEQKCSSCHAQQKQKGKLRLDTPEYIQKGGKSGSVLTGLEQPTPSELIRRLQLPLVDEEHMPPKEKKQVSEDEISLFQWWIEQGASFKAKVKNVPVPEHIKPILKKLENANLTPATTVTHSINVPAKLPHVSVPPVSATLLGQLQAKNMIVLPSGQSSNFVEINFVNVDTFSKTDFQLLAPISSNIVRLKLSRQAVDNQDLTLIAQMTHLSHLHLDFTDITDEGLIHLNRLNHLKYLNLVGTIISEKGLNQLDNLPQLEQIFVYQTPVNVALLNKKLPIDSGGYQVPYFPEDTLHIPIQ